MSLIVFLNLLRKCICPHSQRPPPWQSCAPTKQAVKAKPQRKSIKKLTSKFGQRSQLTAPNYADSTKLGNGFVMGPLDPACPVKRSYKGSTDHLVTSDGNTRSIWSFVHSWRRILKMSAPSNSIDTSNGDPDKGGSFLLSPIWSFPHAQH